MTDHIIKAAQGCGFTSQEALSFKTDLTKLYAIAFAAGMERAAEIAELEGQHQTATLIRTHKEGA